MKSIVQAAGVCSFTRNGCGARVSGRAALGGSCAAGERRSRSTKIRSHHEALGGSALLGLFGPRWLVGGWCARMEWMGVMMTKSRSRSPRVRRLRVSESDPLRDSSRRYGTRYIRDRRAEKWLLKPSAIKAVSLGDGKCPLSRPPLPNFS
jgi:hypothetical protein